MGIFFTDHRIILGHGQLMVLGRFHHLGHDVRVKVHWSCGSNKAFNYCGPVMEGATYGFMHEQQIARFLGL